MTWCCFSKHVHVGDYGDGKQRLFLTAVDCWFSVHFKGNASISEYKMPKQVMTQLAAWPPGLDSY